MKNLAKEKFSQYYENWISQLQEYLHLLLRHSKDQNLDDSHHQALISKLTAHHKDYYTTKWAAAREDVLVFFSPSWLTQLEAAVLWVTGWKPSTAFRLIDSIRLTSSVSAGSSFIELTGGQLRKIEELRVKVRAEEEKVERDMERLQVALADRRMVELARSRAGDGVELSRLEGFVEVALKGLLSGLERIMKMADCARLRTLKGLLEILNPRQSVEFLAANSMVMIQLREFGKNRSR